MTKFVGALLFASLVMVVYCQSPNGGPPQPPPFLAGASPQVIQEFNQIMQNSDSKTDKQLESIVEGWISQQSPDIQAKFNDFKDKMKQQRDLAEKAHKAIASKFSPDAQSADQKLSDIANDPSLTSTQKGEQIKKIMDVLPPNVRNEIMQAMQH